MAMDPAVRNGFAIGFAVVAGLVALYAWREGGLSRFGAGPEGPGELSTPQAQDRGSPQASTEPKPEARTEPPARPNAAPAEAAPEQRAAPNPSAPPADRPSSPGAAVSPPQASKPTTERPPAAAPRASAGATFDVVRVEPSGELVVAGRCAGPCDVQLLANGRPHDAAKSDPQGQWAMTPPPLAPGDYQLALKTRGPGGDEHVSQQTVTVSVPRPPSKDVVVVLNEPNAPSKILQKPEARSTANADAPAGEPRRAPAAGEPRLSISAVDAENGRFFVQGAAPQGARLRIYLNDALVAQAVAGTDSRWSLRVERGLSAGDYTVRVDRIENEAGKVSERAEARFTYEPEVAAANEKPQPRREATKSVSREPEPMPVPSGSSADLPKSPAASLEAATPTARSADNASPASDAANPVIASLETVKVRRGDSLWRISRSAYGHGRRYTVIFQANDAQIRNPNLIYPDQVFVLPAESASPPAGR